MTDARTLRTAVAMMALACAGGAEAADPEVAFPESRWGVSLGGFAGVQPAYEGSDEYRFVAYPLIAPKYFGAGYDADARARVDFRGIDDVRVTAFRYGGLDVGPLAGYSFGRDEGLSSRLAGLGDVDGGLAAGGFISYTFNPVFVDFAYHTQVTGDSDTGYTLRFGAGVAQNLTERMALSAYLGGSYASEDYMDSYFSVTPAQAALSGAGLGVFDAAGGFKDVGLDLGLDYRLTDRLTLQSKAGYARLLNDAAASPITAARNQFSGGLGLTYRFGRTD
ncbi:MAG: MipA/OmpV family protein [Mesorhizobium sp.]|nr:MipA/OmpV family protein [Mesorhizobium sp.]